MLTSERKNIIEETSLDVLKKSFGFLPENPPINLIKILISNNIELREGEFENYNIVGAYKRKKENGKPLIAISKNSSYNRRIFTIAHELGHHFLHKNEDEILFRNSENEFVTEDHRKIEKEADYFAGCLLIPIYLLEKIYSVTDNIAMLSNIFGVSKTAMEIRVRQFIKDKDFYMEFV